MFIVIDLKFILHASNKRFSTQKSYKNAFFLRYKMKNFLSQFSCLVIYQFINFKYLTTKLCIQNFVLFHTRSKNMRNCTIPRGFFPNCSIKTNFSDVIQRANKRVILIFLNSYFNFDIQFFCPELMFFRFPWQLFNFDMQRFI